MKIQDEGLHTPNRHKHFNESFYFNFMDDSGTWGAATRLGFAPNQEGGQRDAFIIFYFPDGKAGFIRCCDSDDKSGEIKSGNFKYTCIKEYKEWRIQYSGPIFYFDDPQDAANFHKITLAHLPSRQVEIDLTFNCYHTPFDFHNAMIVRPISFKRLLQKLHPSYLFSHASLALLKLKSLYTLICFGIIKLARLEFIFKLEYAF